MELLLIGGIVFAAAVLVVAHWVRDLRRQESSCAVCHTCPLPESERNQCAEISPSTTDDRLEQKK